MSSRDDEFNPTREYAAALQKKQNIAKSHRKFNPLFHELQDYRRAYSTPSPPPNTFPPALPFYEQALNHVNTMKAKVATESRRYAFPPAYHFWSGTPERQTAFYKRFDSLFTFLCIRDSEDLGFHQYTAAEWKEILGDVYWKKQWPTKDPYKFNPAVDEAYDPAVFWKYGGKQFFGKYEKDAIDGKLKLSPSKHSCGCLLDNSVLDDPAYRRVVLYHIKRYQLLDDLYHMMRAADKQRGYKQEREGLFIAFWKQTFLLWIIKAF
ncbi:hypothetical protein FA95DRAFT_1613928 [Auriscalpium vulgare]|uniref:Uncharacterized protein n=1 Tax=Auriscalpium vulgare TaxID=40419 RepID=A0ACB8R0S9_9AGAM|nr:hypothetical protein FA95DRAFT_1613928 [Auriscalpium vulgare]